MDTLADAIFSYVTEQPEGAKVEQIAQALGQDRFALGDAFAELRSTGRLLGFGGWWATQETYRILEDRFLSTLAQLHQDRPKEVFQPRERVVVKASLPWAGKVLDRIVERLVGDGRIVAKSTHIRLCAFRPRLSPKQESALQDLIAHWIAVAPDFPSPRTAGKVLGRPTQAVVAMLEVGVDVGDFVALDEAGYAPTAWLRDLIKRARRELPPAFTVAEFRDWLGSSRRIAVGIVEAWDRQGVTERIGDQRRFVAQVD